MRLISTPQLHKWLSESDERVRVYRFDPETEDTWYEIPNPHEKSEISHIPQKKERHWLLSAIPLWIAAIAITFFLCSERHLIAYDEDRPVIDISYTIWGNQLNRVILYDQYGKTAATLSRHNGFGARKLIMTYSSNTGEDDVYMDIYYTNNLQPVARVEHFGWDNTKTIYYTETGLIDFMEETMDGRTTIYRFIQQQDESLPYIPELVSDRNPEITACNPQT